MRTRTHLHRGRAPSSSISAATRLGRRTVHHPCGRALIFIADTRLHHLSAATRPGRRTVFRADALSSSSRTRALIIYLLLLISESAHLYPLSSILYLPLLAQDDPQLYSPSSICCH
ncbi:hypothetical protein R3P38DRAFT_3215915 [Favolaschia claudopus]|uniref:Uncharacterized protein n=1 Tax=Favolaschia claudopus TaxID=2862362 RepID=A0AAW0A893_9AGAR